MVRLFVRLLLWAIALVLILVWLTASAVVWVIEAIVAWRRKTAMPSFQVPGAPSDPKFGRTAGTAVALVAVLLLFGSGSKQPGSPETVRADSPSTLASLAEAPAPHATATTASASTGSSSTPDAEAQAGAARRAERRTARARANRRAARRAAQARAKRRRQRRVARERAAAAAAGQQGASTGSDSGCDPNYEGACLDANASDYDCEGGSGDGPKYTGLVRVVGTDHYDLDRDGDGVACEA